MIIESKAHGAPGRIRAIGLTALLHLGVLGVLLSHVHRASAPVIATPRPPVVLIRLPSAIFQAEQPASPAKKSLAPRPVHERKAPPPPSTLQVSPATPAPPAVAAAASSEAAPTPAAAPPSDAELSVPPPTAYLRHITRIINFEQKYPWSARQYDQQGDVIVRMHLMRDGRVVSVALIRSSGYAALDDEARNVILRIMKFPPFPSDYLPQVGEFDIDQPITFRHYLN